MGVRYPRASDKEGRAADNHQPLVDAVVDGSADVDATLADYLTGGRMLPITVVSAEGLSAPEPGYARALAPLAEADELTIIVYLRRQDEWALSMYRRAVIDGAPGVAGGIEAWLTRDRVAASLDYNAMLENWEAVFGAARLRVKRYPHDLPLVPGFLEAAGLPAAAALLPGGNRRFRESVTDDVLREALIAAGAAPEPPALDQAARDALLKQYRTGNEAIRKRYFPDRATLFGIK